MRENEDCKLTDEQLKILQDGFDQSNRDTLLETNSIKSESELAADLDLFSDFKSDKTADSGPLQLSMSSFKILTQVKGRNYAEPDRLTNYASNLEDLVEAKGKLIRAEQQHK